MRSLFLLALVLFVHAIQAQETNLDSLLSSYGERIELSVMEDNGRYLDSIFDSEMMLDKIMISSAKEEVEVFNEGFKEGFLGAFKFGNLISENIGGEGLLRFLNGTINEEGNCQLIFSCFFDGGINYYDFEGGIENEELTITDVYIYVNGEKFSETIQLAYLSILAEEVPNVAFDSGLSFGMEDVFITQKVKKYAEAGAFQKGYDLLQKTSSGFQKSKYYINYNLMLLAELEDDETYLSYLSEILKNKEETPSVYLLSIDYFFLKENYSELHRVIDSLDTLVGGDVLLDYYRGAAYMETNEFEKSLACFQNVQEEIPFYSYGDAGMLLVYAEQKDYVNALDQLYYMSLIFSYTGEEVDYLLEDYPEFLETKGYKKWKKRTRKIK